MKTLLAAAIAAVTLATAPANADSFSLSEDDPGVTLHAPFRYKADHLGNRVDDARRPVSRSTFGLGARRSSTFGLSRSDRLDANRDRYDTGDDDPGLTLHAPFRDRLYR